MSSYLTKIFKSTDGFGELVEALAQRSIVDVSGLVSSLYPSLADALSQIFGRVVVIVPERIFGETVASCESVLGERALSFPAWDVLPYAHKYPAEHIVAQRIFSLWKFLELRDSVLIATARSFMWRTLSEEVIMRNHTAIEIGAKISQDELVSRLLDAGYYRERVVEFLRTFARRGEIVDFFSPAHSDPIRAEFFGDTIEEMRTFSTRDQRSLARMKKAHILPAVEWLTMEKISIERLLDSVNCEAEKFLSSGELEELVARISLDRHFPGEIWFSPIFEPVSVKFFDFLKKYSPVVISVEPEDIFDEAREFLRRADELFSRVSWEDFPPLPPEFIFPAEDDFKNLLTPDDESNKNLFSSLVRIREIPVDEDVINFSTRRIILSEEPSEILSQMENYSRRGKVFVSAASQKQRERIAQKLGGNIPVPVRYGAISKSFSSADVGVAVLSGDEILGFSRTMFVPERYHQGRAMLAHYGLEQGDFIVHSDYGIAKFLGIEQMEIDGQTTELLKLEFSGGENLYVPMEDFYLVNPYLGPRSAARLSKLGGRKWSSAKRKIRAKIFELAGELVRIYATRQVKHRPPMKPAQEWESELKRTFPFEETPDQQKAIEEVLSDLEREIPMDRLLCGDVGFGKTEVAIRAAVRAVSQGYQVAVLVPTTILAAQHFSTFSQRLENMPIDIKMLCRFTPKREIEKIFQEIDAGKVDIAIGTHMLLSDRVHFANLGLLIIDEEQWFGVRHKEKLKSLRAEVDVLTMTATPIPRTLYFSVSGLRDLSIIETPPMTRRPVFTQIVPWNIDLFKKVIYQEIERGGQVFFVHNRVETIGGIEALLKREMPDVRIAVAHGQMPERKLERTVLDFRDGKYDMLLSTTIIESGTDMPNVNTIIINRADKLGLSQLYQLRGRVGRSDVQAFAYLIIPPYRTMTATARKRLRAIMEHTELGSGYHLAMRDMEIRGAGNLLGREQSGFVEEIGLDLYTKMLAEAVAELRGQKPPIFEPIPFKIDFDAYIPYDYIDDPETRLWAYQRLFTADKVEKIEKMEGELSDRFGRIPPQARCLIDFLRARILATKAGFKYVAFSKRWVALSFDVEKLSLAKLNESLKSFSSHLELELHPSPRLLVHRTDSIEEDFKLLKRVLNKILSS
ncbi:transcription-repair coupling factor [bacterium]|nr:transcription-repair coupling factor [bacterium]